VINQQRHQHVLAVQRSVRRNVRNGLIPRAKIPVARRRENDVAAPRRRDEMRNLDKRVWILRAQSQFVRRRVVNRVARTNA